MNLWHLSPSSINDSSSTISSLLICSGCEADLANFCNSGGHLHSHVYSHTLRLLGGDQVSISLLLKCVFLFRGQDMGFFNFIDLTPWTICHQ